jgi:diadenosine tetraphosphate (Ap4A) HIT family hydrolase
VPTVPETPEELHARVVADLRTPPVETWDTWPFEGAVRPRPLLPPVEREALRHGEGGVHCRACTAGDDRYIWTNDHWRLYALDPPTGLPVVVLLEPREHYEEPGDLPDDLAAELGVLVGRLDRAIRSVDGIGRVHVGRWGEGGAHLHWWFLARPARLEQLRSSFAEIWGDVLPPTPADVWQANLAAVVAALEAQ